MVAEPAELALVHQRHQLTHQRDDVTTDQLMTTSYGACIDKVENYKVLDKLKRMTISVTRIRLGIQVMQNPLNPTYFPLKNIMLANLTIFQLFLFRYCI